MTLRALGVVLFAAVAWLGCGPEPSEPKRCERLAVRVEVPTATPYWANLMQGDAAQWFECRTAEASQASDAIEIEERLTYATVHTCGAGGFDVTLYEPGVVTVHLVYVDRFWVTRALEVQALPYVEESPDDGCPSDEPIEHVVENRVHGTFCVGDEPTGEGCSLVAPVCDGAGTWYPSECALLDTGPSGACPVFPGEVCQ